jgi:hypothetical protein
MLCQKNNVELCQKRLFLEQKVAKLNVLAAKAANFWKYVFVLCHEGIK